MRRVCSSWYICTTLVMYSGLGFEVVGLQADALNAEGGIGFERLRGISMY
jgi:hypothetical protein